MREFNREERKAHEENELFPRIARMSADGLVKAVSQKLLRLQVGVTEYL